jgi:hypothetical protein
MMLASLLSGLSDRLPLNCGCTLADNQSESTMVRIAWPFPLLLTEACGDAKENVRSEFRLALWRRDHAHDSSRRLDLAPLGAFYRPPRGLLLHSYHDPPPLKWSDLRYVFDIKEDCNGKEAIQA